MPIVPSGHPKLEVLVLKLIASAERAARDGCVCHPEVTAERRIQFDRWAGKVLQTSLVMGFYS